jgi:tetratricopeptide repeat protein 30
VPITLAQAKLHWDLEKYEKVEVTFRKSMEFCSEHELWALNVAHVLFMQQTKYKEAISCYEPIVRKSFEAVCLYLLCKLKHRFWMCQQLS